MYSYIITSLCSLHLQWDKPSPHLSSCCKLVEEEHHITKLSSIQNNSLIHPLFNQTTLPRATGITTTEKARSSDLKYPLSSQKRGPVRVMDECGVVSSWIWASLTFTWRVYVDIYLLTIHISDSAVAVYSIQCICCLLLCKSAYRKYLTIQNDIQLEEGWSNFLQFVVNCTRLYWEIFLIFCSIHYNQCQKTKLALT